MEEKEFIIYQNKKGNIVYSILSFILVIIAVLSLFVHFDINIILEIIIKIILFFGVFFFGYACIYFIRRMKKNKEMLIINNKMFLIVFLSILNPSFKLIIIYFIK